ncbi:hypothetical protein KCU65_g9294, partial [Aureobasidium melanogenum]
MPPITAFIVDHRLRPQSTTEAQSTAKYLGQLGLKHEILTLNWGDVSNPSQITNLESTARRMRFQALGRACAAAGIYTLLLAHHADDQAETVLSRIHAGYLGTGLTAIQPKMPIGECHGMYGASKSGYLRHLDPGPGYLPFFVESGGVQVHRPLLDSTKSELIATCTTKCVKWHEDATNADQTLTPRNAIRKLLQSQVLPAALNSDRLRRLAAHKRSQLTACEKTAAAYFKRCLVEIDTQASSVSFRIHPDIETQLIREKDCQLVAAILMRKFFSLVEEQTKLALKDLYRSVGFVFPIAFKDWHADSNSVNIGNVTLAKDSYQGNETDEQKRYIIFSRPVKAPEQFTQTLLEVTEDNHSTSKEPIWTETKLFHDRWWIKLRYIPANVSAGTTVVIRFLKQGESLKAYKWRERQGLDLLPSGKLRYTIPVIVETTKVKQSDGFEDTEERILGFPSVGLRCPDLSTPKIKKGRVTESEMANDSPWQYTCVYKDIDFRESENHTRKGRPWKKGTRPFSDFPVF